MSKENKMGRICLTWRFWKSMTNQKVHRSSLTCQPITIQNNVLNKNKSYTVWMIWSNKVNNQLKTGYIWLRTIKLPSPNQLHPILHIYKLCLLHAWFQTRLKLLCKLLIYQMPFSMMKWNLWVNFWSLLMHVFRMNSETLFIPLLQSISRRKLFTRSCKSSSKLC